MRFNIREEIKLQKEYNTKFKEEMMLYLKKNRDRRVSAYQIYEYMQENNIKINLTTIYRNLDKLTNAGKLLKVKHADDGLYQYLDGDKECEEHLHIQCKDCGGIVHMDHEGMDLINKYVQDECGYTLDCKDSVIMGKCDKCREKK